VALLVMSLGLSGCQYFSNLSNDFHDTFVLSVHYGGLISTRSKLVNESEVQAGVDDLEWGRGGGLEVGLKLTEFFNLNVGASEMEKIEFKSAPLYQLFFHLVDRGFASAQYRPVRTFNLENDIFWERSLGRPLALLYTLCTRQLPEPLVARRSVEDRWYVQNIVRQHPTGLFTPRWRPAPTRAVPPPGMGGDIPPVARESSEGLNIPFILPFQLIPGLSPTAWTDSALPKADRFQISVEANFLIRGFRFGINPIQFVDFLSGIVGGDVAMDNGKRWWGFDLADWMDVDKGPYDEPLPGNYRGWMH
jgi:hypothetical protein